MRHLIHSAVLLGLASTGAAQQPAATARDRAILFTNIDLTPAQQARLDTLWAAHEREAAPIRERMRQDPTDTTTRSARDLMHARMMERVRAVLTPEQQPVFDRNRARLEARRGPHGMPAPGGPFPRN